MIRNSKLSPLVGYHGCDRDVAEKVLSGDETLNLSENSYDWLGRGMYFWVDSYDRAMLWAREHRESPYVIGAFIDPGNCLDLSDSGAAAALRYIYEGLKEAAEVTGEALPVNKSQKDGVFMARHLDCLVINSYTQLVKEEDGWNPYDSVYGVFEEGNELFPGSALKEATHIQIAVINHDCIIGYFRPKELCDWYISEQLQP